MSSTTTTTPYPQAGGKLPSEHDGFAIASLVTAFFLPILGIIFGHLSNHRAKLAHRAKSGLAVAGLILGYLFTAVTALIIVTVVAVAGSTPSVSANAAPPASSAPASPAAPAPAPAKPSTYNLAIGSPVTITDSSSGSKYQVTVNSVKAYAPGEFDSSAPAGQHYIVANVTYKVLSGKASPNELDWETKDSTGQTYDPQMVGGSNTELQATDVQAGNTARGDVYLTIPNGSGGTVVYSAGLSESASWAFTPANVR